MKRTSVTRIGSLALLLLLAAAPALANEWYVHVEAISQQPTNTGLIGGLLEVAVDDQETYSSFEAEPDFEFTGRLGLGVKLGNGFLGVSYWQYSGDDTRSEDLFYDYEGEIYREVSIDESMSGNINFGPFDGRATVFGEIEASTIEISYTMMHESERVNAHYGVGFVFADYEETIVLDLFDFEDPEDNARETYSLETDGMGLCARGGVEIPLGKSFGLYARVGATFLMTETDELLTVYWPDEEGETIDAYRDGRDTSGLIWDLAAGVTVFRNDFVRVGLEYQLSSWGGMVQRQGIGEDELDQVRQIGRDNVAFHGVAATATFSFGE